MNRYLWIALAATGGMLTRCSTPEQRAVAPSPPAPSSADGARITQFYTTKALVSRGDTALVCYGVENATAVWLEPPRQELSAALARCVEVSPVADTTYKLTAEGADGAPASSSEPSPADAARITQFYTTKALVSRGDTALVCYGVENATAVWLEPHG